MREKEEEEEIEVHLVSRSNDLKYLRSRSLHLGRNVSLEQSIERRGDQRSATRGRFSKDPLPSNPLIARTRELASAINSANSRCGRQQDVKVTVKVH